MKTVYTINEWKIKQVGDEYRIYRGIKLIDSSESFDEAYSLLYKYKSSSNEK